MKEEGAIAPAWQLQVSKWVLYALVGIVPLYVSASHFFPFATPKTLLVIFGAGVLAFFYLWHISKQTEISIHWGILDVLLGVYLLACVLSAIHGVNTTLSFFGNLTDAMGINLIIALVIIARIIGSIVRTDISFMRTLLTIGFGSAVIVALGAYLPEAISMSMGGSTFGNSSYAGAYLVVMICVGMALVLLYQKKLHRGLVLTGILIAGCSPFFINPVFLEGGISWSMIRTSPMSVLGSANGATIGLVVAVIVIVSLALIRAHKKALKYAGVTLFIAITVATFWTGALLVTPTAHLHQVYIKEKNANRFVFWDIARRGFLEKPVLGWGMNNYAYVFQKEFDPVFFSRGYAYEPWTNNPHNMFFEYMANGGVVGLLAYVMLLGGGMVTAFRLSARTDRYGRAVSMISVGAIAGYIIQSFFIFDTAVPLLALFVLIGCLIGLQTTKTFVLPERGIFVRKYERVLIGSILLVVIYLGAMAPWRESQSWVSYADFQTIARTQESPYDISYMGDVANTAFIAEKIVSVAVQNIGQMNMEQRQQRAVIVSRLIEHVSQDMQKEPPNFRALWTASKMLNMNMLLTENADHGMLEQSRTYITQALALNPGNALVYFDMAQTYFFEHKFSTGFAWMRMGIALAPEYPKGYEMAHRILTAVPNKQFEQYITTMEKRWSPGQ